MFSFKKALVLIFILSFLPFATLAYETDPEKGTVTVSPVNAEGEAVVGVWYLHRGSLNAITVRNGSSGETFQVEPGSYYLEARSKITGAEKYYAYVITSENPQYVSAGETIEFNITYYPTQEDMIAATTAVTEPVEVEVEPIAEEDENQEETEEEVIEEPTAEEEQSAEDEESLLGNIIDYVVEASEEVETMSEIYVPTFETAPQPDVPTFETSPSNDLGVGGVGGDEILFEITELAVTGPATLLLLIPSVMGGLLFASRKKRK